MVDKISRLVKENQILSDLLFTTSPNDNTQSNNSSTTILDKLLVNIENNTIKCPRSRRHNETIKKFATILYIYTGSMAYEFIHQNMPQALPSLRTVQSLVLIQLEYSHIEEAKFRFDELQEHLSKHDAPKIVAVAENATHILHKVEYDPTTNCCVGFVLPTDDLGLPKIDEHQAVSFEAIEKMFKTIPIAKYAYLYVIQPLKMNTPSFCLACLGTNNKFTAEPGSAVEMEVHM